MLKHYQILALALGAAGVAHAGGFDYFSDRGCSVLIGSNQVPAERGCTTLGQSGNVAGSVKPTGTYSANCLISFWDNESCNGNLAGTIDAANSAAGTSDRMCLLYYTTRGTLQKYFVVRLRVF